MPEWRAAGSQRQAGGFFNAAGQGIRVVSMLLTRWRVDLPAKTQRHTQARGCMPLILYEGGCLMKDWGGRDILRQSNEGRAVGEDRIHTLIGHVGLNAGRLERRDDLAKVETHLELMMAGG